MSLPSKELSEQALDALIARERTRIVAPLTEWRSLALQLRDEGLLRAPGSGPGDARAGQYAGYGAGYGQAPPRVTPRERVSWLGTTARWTMRIAASAALVAVGIIAGRGMTIGGDIAHTIQMAIADSTDAGTHVRVSGAPFRSAAEARNALVKSETEYERAAAYLAATDTAARTNASPDVLRDRLAALNEMSATALKALRDAPDDPLLNQYYLSTLSAQEATLQRLSQSLPADARVIRF
jgi:hypothetical protein